MQDRWNQRYSKPLPLPSVSYGLQRYAHLLPTTGSGLDLACGLGQNAIFLQKQGLMMHAWDYSTAGLAQMKDHCNAQKVEVNQHYIDVTTAPWPSQSFDLICITAFLHRNLCPQIMSHLNPGGILVYQTFNQVADIAGKKLNKPRRKAFLLDQGELLQLFHKLEPLVYHDEQERSLVRHPLVGKALLIAQKPS